MPGSPRPGSQGAPTQGWERPLLRSRRSWVWNQFFVIEEYAGPEPVLIGRLHSDVDRGEGQIKYVLTGEGAGTVFVIDERTGNVLVTKTLDREEKAQYTLLAQAVDQASNRPLEPPSEFIIKVQDVNDHPPVCPRGPYHATPSEMSSVGTSVIQVTAQDAHDPSSGNSSKLVHMVLEGPLLLHRPPTGVVCTAIPNMDREAQAELLVVIQAKDMGGQAGGLLGSVTVTLSDVNDNPPKFPQKGGNARLQYRLLDGDGPFAISTDPLGRAGLLTLSQPLDFEQRPAYTLRVEAANTQVDPLYIRQGPFKDVAAVEDAAEPPAFARPSYQLGVPEDSPPAPWWGRSQPPTWTCPAAPSEYSILPHSDPGRYFSISPQDGTLRTALPLDRETLAWHNITVVATELDSPARAAPVPLAVHALDVNDNVPQLAPGTEPFICHGTAPGQLIQTIWARDRDDGGAGSRVTIRSPPGAGAPQHHCAGQRGWFSRSPAPGPVAAPPRWAPPAGAPGAGGWGTSRPDGHPHPDAEHLPVPARWQPALLPAPPPRCPCPPGLSTAALLAILGCGTSLLALAGLLAWGRPKGGRGQRRRRGQGVRKHHQLRGGRGRHPGLRHGCPAASTRPRTPPWPPPPASPPAWDGPTPTPGPPHDSLQVYGYDGGGHALRQPQPPGLLLGGSEGEGGNPGEWGPLFCTVAELYGGQEGPA
ncbi:unnamed protein product [Caretta caretta]